MAEGDIRWRLHALPYANDSLGNRFSLARLLSSLSRPDRACCSERGLLGCGKRRGFPVTDFYIHWALDLVLISIVLYGLGGALLPSSITGYILIVITSAVFISKKASFLVAPERLSPMQAQLPLRAWVSLIRNTTWQYRPCPKE